MAKRTVTDEQILAAVLDVTGEDGTPPGPRAVAKRLGMSPSAVHRRVAKLSEQGVVDTQHGIRLLPGAIDHLTQWKTGSVSLHYVYGPAGLTVYSGSPSGTF
jgi:DNA-binding transcriptional LysR family regulator